MGSSSVAPKGWPFATLSPQKYAACLLMRRVQNRNIGHLLSWRYARKNGRKTQASAGLASKGSSGPPRGDASPGADVTQQLSGGKQSRGRDVVGDSSEHGPQGPKRRKSSKRDPPTAAERVSKPKGKLSATAAAEKDRGEGVPAPAPQISAPFSATTAVLTAAATVADSAPPNSQGVRDLEETFSAAAAGAGDGMPSQQGGPETSKALRRALRRLKRISSQPWHTDASTSQPDTSPPGHAEPPRTHPPRAARAQEAEGELDPGVEEVLRYLGVTFGNYPGGGCMDKRRRKERRGCRWWRFCRQRALWPSQQWYLGFTQRLARVAKGREGQLGMVDRWRVEQLQQFGRDHLADAAMGRLGVDTSKQARRSAGSAGPGDGVTAVEGEDGDVLAREDGEQLMHAESGERLAEGMHGEDPLQTNRPSLQAIAGAQAAQLTETEGNADADSEDGGAPEDDVGDEWGSGGDFGDLARLDDFDRGEATDVARELAERSGNGGQSDDAAGHMSALRAMRMMARDDFVAESAQRGGGELPTSGQPPGGDSAGAEINGGQGDDAAGHMAALSAMRMMALDDFVVENAQQGGGALQESGLSPGRDSAGAEIPQRSEDADADSVESDDEKAESGLAVVSEAAAGAPEVHLEDLLGYLVLEPVVYTPSSCRALSAEESAAVDAVFRPGSYSASTEVALLGTQVVTAQELRALDRTCWLNDQVVNFYMDLLLRRNQAERERKTRAVPRVHVLNSFFYTRLLSSGAYDYGGVRRWTKKVNVFEHDVILTPINLNNTHWALISINMNARCVEYYDSLSGPVEGTRARIITQTVLRYLEDESRDKLHRELDQRDKWSVKQMLHGVPKQGDGGSCGVFVCAYADLLAQGARPPFAFSQANIRTMRRTMAADILAEILEPA